MPPANISKFKKKALYNVIFVLNVILENKIVFCWDGPNF